MTKIVALTTIAFLYGTFCWNTMPDSCFKFKNAGQCQKTQLAAIADFRNVDWSTVNSIREVK